jgi:glutamate-1-semialdehyde 2,1-aminomutase
MAEGEIKKVLRDSSLWFQEAKKSIPGGVDSPVRAFQSVGGTPFFVKSGHGSKLVDVEGREYIDFVCSYGPLILGHAHPAIVRAIQDQVKHGTSYGAPTPLEVELANLVKMAMPSIDLVRFVNSGTEATMSAVRLARAFTKRKKILKFECCYHGHGDSFLSKAGSGLATLGISASPGVPEEIAALTLNAPYNNVPAVQKIFETEGSDIAAVIVEPIPANTGVLLPRGAFLSGLREITEQYDSLLIFDEVISGFRLAFGGAQEFVGVHPDLTTLGKIIGGGLPVGAYGGRGDVMSMVAPLGPVYQAGTLSGNPLAMRAGIETLRQLQMPNFYKALNEKTLRFVEALQITVKRRNWPVTINHIGSMLTMFFTAKPVVDYESAKTSDTKAYAHFFHEMLKRKIFLAPSQFEAMFVSSAHTIDDLSATADAAEQILEKMF